MGFNFNLSRVIHHRHGKRFGFGWVKDRHDPRDLHLTLKAEHIAARPISYDPRSQFDPCYDQSNLGSCVGNGVAGDVQYIYKTTKKIPYMPSRLMIYYDARALEGTIGQDAGCEIRDAIKSMNTQGAADEKVWPYNIAKFTTRPSAAAYAEGKLHESLKYERVNQSDVHLETRLSQGYPIIIGLLVYDSFLTDQVANTGIVPVPNAGLPWQKSLKTPVETLQGGHCMLAVGYDGHRNFIVRNSWGTSWGMKGYCLIPYNYVCCSDLGSDFWTITLME